MQSRGRRWVLAGLASSVVAIVVAGVLVLFSESGTGTAPAGEGQAYTPGPEEIARSYLQAFAVGDIERAARLTDNPEQAKQVLSQAYGGVGADKIKATTAPIATPDGDTAEAGGTYRIEWKLAQNEVWAYEGPITLARNADGWKVRWSPALVHPDLKPNQRLAARSAIGEPAVLDRDGQPLLVWRPDGAKPADGVDAPLLLPAMGRIAREQAADSVSVVTVDTAGNEVKTLYGTEATEAEPLTSTVSLSTQRAAQAAVDTADKPAMLVAIQPSTGELLAVAQNTAAGGEPRALSGLYSPGSTFKIATAVAALQSGVDVGAVLPCPGKATIGTRTIPNDGQFDLGSVPLHTAFARSCNTTFAQLAADLPADGLAKAADQLGLNADFVIPGLTTEAGLVEATGNPVQRLEDGIGQGKVQASPFGVALMAATVASGKALTPSLWRGDELKTGVQAGYRAPPEQVLGLVRGMMREVVTGGTATSLRRFGDVRGKTGTAQLATDPSQAHGWFAGYRGDVAFAVLVAGAGSSDPAEKVTGAFLGG